MGKEKLDSALINSLKAELQNLDNELIDVEGNSLKASQCYSFELDPLHVLFNTNCPDHLRDKVNSILTKYMRANASRA